MGVSTTVAAILLVVMVVQVALQVFALVDLARRNAVQGGKKWVWALVIAFGNLIGAIVYLAVGRRPTGEGGTLAGSGASTAGGDAARRAVDELYGRPDRR
jgi:hypothetical protein